MRGIQSIIGYKFKNNQILREALIVDGRRTTILANDRVPSRQNRGLALVGDSVLRLAVVEAGYKAGQSIGMISEWKELRLSNVALSAVGRASGITTLVERCHSLVKPLSPHTIAATVEAIVGAVYMDKGLDHIPTVLQRLGISLCFGSDSRIKTLKSLHQTQSLARLYKSNTKLRMSAKELQPAFITRTSRVDHVLRRFSETARSIDRLVLSLDIHRPCIPLTQDAEEDLPKISHDPPLQTAIAMHSASERLSISTDTILRLALESSIMGRLVLNVRDSSYAVRGLINSLQPRHVVVRRNVAPKSEALVNKIIETSHEIERMVLDGQD